MQSTADYSDRKVMKGTSLLTVTQLRATQLPLADSVDHDQTAQNMQSDLGSTLPDILFSK